MPAPVGGPLKEVEPELWSLELDREAAGPRQTVPNQRRASLAQHAPEPASDEDGNPIERSEPQEPVARRRMAPADRQITDARPATPRPERVDHEDPTSRHRWESADQRRVELKADHCLVFRER